MEILKEDASELMDIIKFDYLSFNKRRGMPSFIERGLSKEEEQEIKEKIRGKISFKELLCRILWYKYRKIYA